jgi:hypothetical protein
LYHLSTFNSGTALSELRELRGPLGLQIERDLHFEPQTLDELYNYHRRLRDERSGGG